ncbi:MAG: hypothetical protein ABJ327_20085 [Litoreibacter sp.]
MRLILCDRYLDIAKKVDAPDDTFVFTCCEDFSVGSIQDWNAPTKFHQARSELWWKETNWAEVEIDYRVWLQVLPNQERMTQELAAKTERGEIELQEPYKFEDLAPKADQIELWADASVRSSVWRWYMVATLERMGVDLSRVFVSNISEDGFREHKKRFWTRLVNNAEDRAFPADQLSQAQLENMIQYWEAAVSLPTPINPEFAASFDESTRHVFNILSARHPDPETRLSNIEARLLKGARSEWKKMAYVVANAMGKGWDDNDSVGHSHLQIVLKDMALKQPALVEIKGQGEMRFCDVRLTSLGQMLQNKIQIKKQHGT